MTIKHVESSQLKQTLEPEAKILHECWWLKNIF